MNDLNHLLFRRQYLFGTDPQVFPEWKRISMPNGYQLTAHPDLNLSEYQGQRFNFVLLGQILDPLQPTFNNDQILNQFDKTAMDVESLFDLLYDKSGHYVLFVTSEDFMIVLNDAGGLKQVYYHQDEKGRIWLSSFAPLIASQLNLPLSDEAQQYMSSSRYQEKIEPWWPGDFTPFHGVHHLYPNHYLNLKSFETVRFWPFKQLKRYSLKEGTRLAGDLLKGSCEAGNNRFDAIIAFTGGFDSRSILAASRSFADQVEGFSSIYRKLTSESQDIVISRSIATKINMKYTLVESNQEIPPEFLSVYDQSTQGYKTDWVNIVYGRYTNIPAEKVIFKGNITEIVRSAYWQYGDYPAEVSLETLMNKLNLGNNPAMRDGLREWMQDALYTEKLGYKLLDMFAWEVQTGSWAAMSHSIFGLTHEEFSPFGNRKLLEIMLGVHHRQRVLPKATLQQEMVRYLWPELAVFPYHSSWNLSGYKKRFFDAALLNFFRKMRHKLKRQNDDRLV